MLAPTLYVVTRANVDLTFDRILRSLYVLALGFRKFDRTLNVALHAICLVLTCLTGNHNDDDNRGQREKR